MLHKWTKEQPVIHKSNAKFIPILEVYRSLQLNIACSKFDHLDGLSTSADTPVWYEMFSLWEIINKSNK